MPDPLKRNDGTDSTGVRFMRLMQKYGPLTLQALLQRQEEVGVDMVQNSVIRTIRNLRTKGFVCIYDYADSGPGGGRPKARYGLTTEGAEVMKERGGRSLRKGENNYD